MPVVGRVLRLRRSTHTNSKQPVLTAYFLVMALGGLFVAPPLEELCCTDIVQFIGSSVADCQALT